MRTQEQKQYDENGKYIHKCMEQNCNREETEGEELTAPGRGELSLQEVRWPMVWGKRHRLSGRNSGFIWSFWSWLIYRAAPASVHSCEGAPALGAGGAGPHLESTGGIS